MTVGMIIGISLLVILIISVVAAIFVYGDAKKRDMNATVWAIVAFFGPFLLGVIVYLVSRNPLVELQCSKCGAVLPPSVKECPQCKTALLTQCPNCEFPVQKDWKACPKCGSELPQAYEQPVQAYGKEKGYGAVVAIIVLLAFMIFAGVFSVWSVNSEDNELYDSNGYSGFEGMYNIGKEDLMQNEAITSWISSCDTGNKEVYVLLSKSSRTCLVYLKDSEKLMTSSIDLDYHMGKCSACIFIEESQYDDNFGYDFFLYEFEIYEDTNFTAYVNGNVKDVGVSFTEFDISQDTWEEK